MRIDLSSFKHGPAPGAVLLASIVSLTTFGATAPALAGCGGSSYQNLGGVHSAAAKSGVHTATSNAPSGSTGAPTTSSCPTANATANRAAAGALGGHAVNPHVAAGNSRLVERTADENKPHSATAGPIHTANLKKAKE